MARKNLLLLFLSIFVIALFTLFIFMAVKTPCNFEVPAHLRWHESSVNTSSPIISMSLDVNSKNIIYAVSLDNFFVSKDAGLSFRKVFSTSSNSNSIKPHTLFLHRIAFVPSSDTVVFTLRSGNKDQVFSYNCLNQKIRKIFEVNSVITDIENNPQSDVVFISTYTGDIYMYGKNVFRQVVKSKGFHFTSIGFLPNGVIVAGLDGNPGMCILPIVKCDKDRNFNCDVVYNTNISRDEVPINIRSVYCIRTVKNGIYISTSSERVPVLFTADGKTFSIVKRIKKVTDSVYGIRCIQPVPEYNGFFFTADSQDYFSNKNYLKDVRSLSICFIRPYAKSAIVCLNPFLSKLDINVNLNIKYENLNIDSFVFIPSLNGNGRIIISAGDKIYTAIIKKETLISGLTP